MLRVCRTGGYCPQQHSSVELFLEQLSSELPAISKREPVYLPAEEPSPPPLARYDKPATTYHRETIVMHNLGGLREDPMPELEIPGELCMEPCCILSEVVSFDFARYSRLKEIDTVPCCMPHSVTIVRFTLLFSLPKGLLPFL